MKPLISRSLARIAAIGAGAWFAFWACAPPATLPPPVPMGADQTLEVGAAGEVGRAWNLSDPSVHQQLYGGQAWIQFRMGEPTEVGGVLAASNPGLFAGGGYFRYRPVHLEHFTLGAQIEGGWLWAAFGVPVAFSPVHNLWFYTAPKVGINALGLVQLPVGASYQLGDHGMLDLELGTFVGQGQGGYNDFGTTGGYFPAYLSLGFAYRN